TAFALRSLIIYAVLKGRVTWVDPLLQFPYTVIGADLAFAGCIAALNLQSAIGYACLTILLIAGTIVTFTKAQLVAMAAGMVLICFLSRESNTRILRNIFVLATGSVLVACTVLVASGSVRDSFFDLWRDRVTEKESTEIRMGELQIAFENFVESPVFGKG